jgi:predicted PurR-regulated permease PerM
VARDRLPSNSNRTNALIITGIVIAALYVGRDVVLPFALAVLIAFLLAPAVKRLERWRIRRIPAALTVVTLALALTSMLGYFVAKQAYDFAYNLPSYEGNIVDKLRSLPGSNDGAWGRATQAIADVRQKLLPNDSKSPPPRNAKDILNESLGAETDVQLDDLTSPKIQDDTPGSIDPIQVEVVKRISTGDVARSLFGPLVSPLATAMTVFIFVVFMLLEREDLRNRVIRVIGGNQLNLTTKALDDAIKRVSRYLLMQLVVNAIFGLTVAVGLFLIGIPNAILWGTIAMVLRFIPMIGPLIAALMPLALSFALFSGWTQPLLVLGLFFLCEVISANILETWLCGTSTGISTIGILMASIFWSWMWGPIGLVLATPLTVCVTVLGRYVPQLAILNELIGDEEVLSPPSRYYQRLLSDDVDEATSIADDFLARHSLQDLYDKVLLPALSLAEQDRHQGILDDTKLEFVQQTTRDYVDELSLLFCRSDEIETIEMPKAFRYARIACLPAHDKADEIAAVMLAQLLKARGMSANIISIEALSGEVLNQIEAESVRIVCISGLQPFATTHARYLCKRLRPKFPQLKITVGLWQSRELSTKSSNNLKAAGSDHNVTTLSGAVETLMKLASSAEQPTLQVA